MGVARSAEMTAILTAASARPRRTEGVTIAGVVAIGIWVIILAVVIVTLMASIDSDRLATYGGRIAYGFLTTLRLVAWSVVVGAILSIPVAVGRLSDNRFIGALAYGYSYFFRGTPLIAQVFLIYYGVGQFAPQLKAICLWWFFKDAFNCAVLAFALNSAAYQAEILSGAIRNVPIGQIEAARALGLRGFTALRNIVLPQALISALRPYGNEVILIIKASAIASIITVLDLMGQTRFVYSKTYDLSFYFWAALFYLVTVEVLSRVVNVIERRMTRHIRPAPSR
jgi:polar amino acid transport system permease protein